MCKKFKLNLLRQISENPDAIALSSFFKKSDEKNCFLQSDKAFLYIFVTVALKLKLKISRHVPPEKE